MSVCCKVSLLVDYLICHSFLKLQASYTSNAPIGGLVSDRLRAELSTLIRPRSRLWRPSRSTTAGAPLSDRGSVTGCSLAFCQMHRFTRAISAFWPKNYEATCICNLYLRDLYVYSKSYAWTCFSCDVERLYEMRKEVRYKDVPPKIFQGTSLDRIGLFKCSDISMEAKLPDLLGNYDRRTNRPLNRPTARPANRGTDRQEHREASLTIIQYITFYMNYLYLLCIRLQ